MPSVVDADSARLRVHSLSVNDDLPRADRLPANDAAEFGHVEGPMAHAGAAERLDRHGEFEVVGHEEVWREAYDPSHAAIADGSLLIYLTTCDVPPGTFPEPTIPPVDAL